MRSGRDVVQWWADLVMVMNLWKPEQQGSSGKTLHQLFWDNSDWRAPSGVSTVKSNMESTVC